MSSQRKRAGTVKRGTECDVGPAEAATVGHFLRNSSTAVTSTRIEYRDALDDSDGDASGEGQRQRHQSTDQRGHQCLGEEQRERTDAHELQGRDQDSGDARKCGADNPVELRDGVGPYAGEPRRVGIVGNGPNRDAEACSMEEPAEQQRRPHGDRQHRKLLVRDAHVADLDRLVREDEPRGLRIDAVEVQ